MPSQRKSNHRAEKDCQLPPASMAEQLLDAHVQWLQSRLTGPALETLIENELDAALVDASHLTLNSVITAEIIKETAATYAIDFELHGAMPELVGEIADLLYRHKSLKRYKLEDLIPENYVVDFVDKALELTKARDAIVHASVSNPVFSSLISRLVYRGAADFVERRLLSGKIPGARKALLAGQKLIKRTRPDIEKDVQDSLNRYVQNNLSAYIKTSEKHLLASFDGTDARDLLLDAWDEIRHSRLSDTRDYAAELDIDEIVVLLYEYWRHLRKTPIFKTLLFAGIDAFFEKYGDQTLAIILEEIGLNRNNMLAEAMRHAPHVLKALDEQDRLEPILRRNLQGFYESAEANAIFTSNNQST